MKPIFAGLMVFGIAFFWNRLLRFIGINEQLRIGLLIPVSEELIKYCVAFTVQLHPIFVCFIFGLGEGLYETFHIKKHPRWIILSAATGTHLAFGLGYLSDGLTRQGLIIALVFHILWNTVIFKQNKLN